MAVALALVFAAPASAARPSAVYHRAEIRAARADVCANSRVVQAAPHPALTGMLGVLRREPTAADALRGMDQFPVASRVYGRHVRLARTVDGNRYYLVPFRRVLFIARPGYASCRRRIVREVRRIDPRAVAYARRRTAREGRAARLAPDAVEIVGPSFVVGQGTTARGLGRTGAWSGDGRQVALLLPDVVATVRSHHDGFVADVVVESNLAIFEVPRGHGVEPELVEWFDASATKINEVRPREEIFPD